MTGLRNCGRVRDPCPHGCVLAFACGHCRGIRGGPVSESHCYLRDRHRDVRFRDRIAEAIERYKEAIPAEAGLKTLLNRYAMFGLAFFCIKNYGEALRNAENSLAIGPDYWVTHIVRIAALERLGRHNECAEAIAAYAVLYSDPTVAELEWLPFTNSEVKEDFLGALRDAGLPEN